MEVLHKDLFDDKYRPCPLLRQYVDAGRLGIFSNDFHLVFIIFFREKKQEGIF